MDFSLLFQPLFNALWFLIPLAVFGALIKSAWFKGKVGEAFVNLVARLLLDRTRYHLIKNVTLRTEDGTTQIDHIIVSRYGVFVVETKNMKGWIFGNEKQHFWTQKIYKHSQKFQNPLHQNYKHLKTLQSLLSLRDEQIRSLVVFVGDSTFKTPMPANVIHGAGYIRFIKSYTEDRLTESEVTSVIDAIESGRLAATFKNHRQHTAHVRQILAKKEGEPKCPKCQGSMVKRKVKRGANVGNEFLGCKAFPACRGILNLKAE